MSWGFWASELLRESRWLFSSAGCPSLPWGAIAFVVLCAFLVGCCCGGVAAFFALSASFRGLSVGLLRLAVGALQDPRLPEVRRPSSRLAEYRTQ